jgi:hypothetical protein
MWLLLDALLWLATPAAVAHAVAEAPDGAELEASQAVLEESAPEPRPKPSEHERAALLEVTWSTMITASGGEPETNLQLDATGWRVEDVLRPRRDKFYPSTFASFYSEVDATDWLLVRGLVDTREIRDGSTLEPPLDGLAINGNPAEQELRSGSLVRELSLVFGNDAFSVEVGRFRSSVADGLIYKDFGTGARVRANLQNLGVAPLQAELLLTTVGQRVQDLDNNQLAALRVDWLLSAFDYLGLFVAGAADKNGEISDVLRSAYAETLIPHQRRLDSLFLQEKGSGGQAYVGAVAQIITSDNAVLRARFVLSGGRLKLKVPLDQITTPAQVLDGHEIEVHVGGYAADFELRYGLSDFVEVTGYGFVLSGDEPPQQDGAHYRSFIGLAPYWVWSGLFFSGGLTQGLYPNRAAAGGVNGRGVLGGGPALEWNKRPVRAELRAMFLRAMADPPAPPLGGTSRTYGLELDWLAQWRALPWLGLGAEVDVFFPGHFFPIQRVAYLTLAMVTLTNAD